MSNAQKGNGLSNVHNAIKQRQTLTRNAPARLNNLNGANPATAAAGLNSFANLGAAPQSAPPPHVLPPPRHHGAHYQVHQQMYMDRMRMPAPNQPNDFYYSEMHSSSWQYSSQPQFFANMSPQGTGNMQFVPNLNVPPPPYGMYPGNGSIYSGYASYQSNSGFIGSNGAVVTNSVGAVGAMGSISVPVFPFNPRNSGTHANANANNNEAANNAANMSKNSSSSSNSSMNTSGNKPHNHRFATNNSNAHAPKRSTSDACIQVNLLPNIPPLERLNNRANSSASSSSCGHSQGLNMSNLNTSGSIGAGDGEVNSTGASTSTPIDGKLRQNSEVLLSQQKLHDVTRVSLRGSELAEKLAYVHRNRPCFKKIDSLCARMKQDLIRPDGVLPNINSQGIAWAVKDFIFVFTRVVNAWIIMKGYIYNTPDGLNKIKNVLPEGFMESFSDWQDTTLVFIEYLIKAFISLDGLVHHQKASFTKKEDTITNNANGNNVTGSPAPNNTSTPNKNAVNLDNILSDTLELFNSINEKTPAEGLNKNYKFTMVEDSEETQRHANANGTYFKTGTYQPLQKSEEEFDEALAAASNNAAMNSHEPNLIEPILGSASLNLDVTGIQSNPVAAATTSAAPPPTNVNAPVAVPPSLPTVTGPVHNNIVASADAAASLPMPLNLRDIYGEDLTNDIWTVKSTMSVPSTSLQASANHLLPSHASFINAPTTTTQIFSSDFINLNQQHTLAACNQIGNNNNNIIINNNENNNSRNVKPPINTATFIGRQNKEKLSEFGDRILQLKNTEAFFKKDFTKNYYPDFVVKCRYDYVDLRSIVLKCQDAQYHHVNEAIHDLRGIVYVVRKYLMSLSPNDQKLSVNEQLKTALDKYESEVTNLLDRHPYRVQDYDHIKGEPSEKIFNYTL